MNSPILRFVLNRSKPVPSFAKGGRPFLGARRKKGCASTSSARTVLGVSVILLLSGCGKVQDLRPATGKTFPVKPATAANPPSAGDLLRVPTQSRPGRSDELLNRSADRPDDKFDLPPR